MPLIWDVSAYRIAMCWLGYLKPYQTVRPELEKESDYFKMMDVGPSSMGCCLIKGESGKTMNEK